MISLRSILPRALRNRFVIEMSRYSTRQRAWNSVRMDSAMSDAVACLRKLLPASSTISEKETEEYLEELDSYRPFQVLIEQHKESLVTDFRFKMDTVGLAAKLFCYVAIRIIKPNVIIETGCATGTISAFILLALNKNGNGHLYSIDIPAVAGERSMDWSLPRHLEPGFMIPAELRDKWTLILGDARYELIPLLSKQATVDVFFHDSDHTYEHMMWEYTSAWPYLSDGGLLISDDIRMNLAFWDFAQAMGRPIVMHASNPNLGAFSKKQL